jgi:O-antigen/teichoic acid export membrane protein
MNSSDTEQLLDPAYVEDAAAVAQSDAGDGVEPGGFARKLARWTTKGGLAILDQGLISGSNFAISIVLANLLAPVQYGAFSLAFSVFLLLSYVYQSLLSEPQGVFSGSAYSQCLRGYLKALLGIQAMVTIFGIVLLGGSAAVVYFMGKADGLPGALAGVAIASPCILFFWLLRRAYYMNLAPARAAVGALIYCGLVAGGLWLAYKETLVSPFSAYLMMAIGALGAGFYLLSQVNKVLPPDTVKAPTAGQAWHKHWEYGRWALAVSVVTWIPYYMYYPLVSAFNGMAQAGQLRALMNLSLPMEQTYTALSILFLPYAARVCREKGIRRFGPAGAAHHAALCGGCGGILGGADSAQGVRVPRSVPGQIH